MAATERISSLSANSCPRLQNSDNENNDLERYSLRQSLYQVCLLIFELCYLEACPSGPPYPSEALPQAHCTPAEMRPDELPHAIEVHVTIGIQ